MAEKVQIPVEIQLLAKEIEVRLKTIQESVNGIAKASRSVRKLDFLSFTVGLNQGLELVRRVSDALLETVAPFREFETGLIAIGKTTNAAGQELAELGDEFRQLALSIPVSVDELQNIGVIAGQLGIRGTSNITRFTDTVAKLTRTTVLGGEEAATSLARIFNILGEDIQTVDRFADVIVTLGNNFAANEREIVSLTGEIARSASEFNLSSTNVAALSAALKALGQRTEGAGTQIGRSLRAIQAAITGGGSAFEELIRLTGLSGEELRKTFAEDSFKVFQLFIKGLNQSSGSLGATEKSLRLLGIEGERALKVIPALSEGFNEFERATNLANLAAEEGGAANEEFRRTLDSLDTIIIQIRNDIRDLGISFGQDLAPQLKDSLRFIRGLIVSYREFEKTLRGFGANFPKQIREQNDALTEQIDKVSELIRLRRDAEAAGASDRQLAILDKNIAAQEQLLDIELQRRRNLTQTARTVKDVEQTVSNAAKATKQLGTQIDLKQLKKDFKSIENIGKDLNRLTIFGLQDELEMRLNTLELARKEGLVNEKKFQEIRLGLERDAAEKIKKIRASITQDPIGGFILNDRQIRDQLEGLRSQIDIDLTGGATLAGVVNKTLQGAKGAVDLLAGGVAAFADTILPGLGQVAGQIFEVLAQGPEQVRAFIQEFVRAIPQIIENVILSIPVLIEELAKALPQIIERLAERAPEIISALVRAMPRVATALALQAPRIAIELTKALVKQLPRIASEFVKALIDELGNALGSIGDAFGGLGGGGGGLGGIFGGGGIGAAIGGGGGGVIGAIGGFFQDGGLVPAGFPNDSFLAGLTSGELVIDRTDTADLVDFLRREKNSGGIDNLSQRVAALESGSGGSRNLDLKLVLGEREFARLMVDLDRRGFRTA